MTTNYLDRRRRELGMSIPALAVRSGVPESTVKRVLNGGLDKAALGTVRAVANALGVTVQFSAPMDSDVYQELQASQKAIRIVRMVQGTSALEAQAIPDAVVDRMVRRTAAELVTGSARRLWAE
jgi:transcriptional regulator with XRE-family HTH domain